LLSPELRVKLQEAEGASEVLRIYADAVAGTIDLTSDIAQAAFELRKAINRPIPTADALIADAAVIRGYQLVHWDAHLATVTENLLA
jgi:predicted nucleic acid-binding protein